MNNDQLAGDNHRRQEVETLATQRAISIIWQSPCHEAFLLRHVPGRLNAISPGSATSNANLLQVWPGYTKSMSRLELSRRIDCRVWSGSLASIRNSQVCYVLSTSSREFLALCAALLVARERLCRDTSHISIALAIHHLLDRLVACLAGMFEGLLLASLVEGLLDITATESRRWSKDGRERSYGYRISTRDDTRFHLPIGCRVR